MQPEAPCGIADRGNFVVRRIDEDGTVTATIAQACETLASHLLAAWERALVAP